MTRAQFSKRCIPISFVVALAVCALLAGAVATAAGSGSAAVLYASNGVSASVRSIQPAVSGLFQVHAPRAWVDAVDESGVALVNGIPDLLDSWDAFNARASWAVLKSGYAFTTIDGLGHEVLYAGVQRASSKGPSDVVLEFSQKAGERLLGDLRISAKIDAAGGVEAVQFESFAGEAKGGAKFLPLAILAGEGCNDAGTACVVANGALLEVGYNLTALGKPEKEFSGIQIRTPEGSASGRLSPMFSSSNLDCVKEVGGINNPVCTAGDVKLGEIVEGSLVVTEGCNGALCSGGTRNGLGCNFDSDCPGGTCPDFVTFTAIAKFTAGPQRYDVGVYFSTDGDPQHDGARSGNCDRFALPTSGNYCLGGDREGLSCTTNAQCTGSSPTPNGTCLSYVNLDNDTCGDINANQILEAPVTVTIKCADNNIDQKADIFHCETWGQNKDDVICGSNDPGSYVKAGTPSKCDCSLLTGPGACIPVTDGNPCTVDVCEGSCSNSSTTTCSTDATCLIGGVQGQCQGITLVHKAGNAGTECRASTGSCDPAESCTGTSTSCPADVKDTGECCDATTGAFKDSTTACTADTNVCTVDHCAGTSSACLHTAGNAGTICRGSLGACDPAETCTGASSTCPADAKSSAECRPSGGVCDPAESCDGVNNTCPADAKSTAVCRPAAAGGCDLAESCDGLSNDCPGNVFKASSVECRASVCGTALDCCDVAENCTGNSATCPTNVFQPATHVCRAEANSCDAPEYCPGDSATCPGNLCSGAAPDPTILCSQ